MIHQIQNRGDHVVLFLQGKHGGEVKLNKADIKHVNKAKNAWYLNSGQAVSTLKGGKLFLARLIAGAKREEVVMWIDGDKMNCRRSNLTTIKRTKRQGPRQRGVYYESVRQKWRAAIHRDGKLVRLGDFDTFEDAVAARKSAENEDAGVSYDSRSEEVGRNGGRPWRLHMQGRYVGRFATREEAIAARGAGGTPPPPKETRGVRFEPESGRWRATHHKTHIGRYDTREEAIEAKRRYERNLKRGKS